MPKWYIFRSSEAISEMSLLFVCFIALHPSQRLWSWQDGQVSKRHFFFLGKLEQAVNQYSVHILSFVTDKQPFLNDSAEGRRMTVEIIS